ncbi:hypothetical protein SIAM614_21522 [Stappia aggregata IAM 12614]|uniref:Uncharacterized protein n=2 Tax=Roseibium aggregatum TaxID=187304 RepID=A0P339_ROSAI|nr:hypothetical protein SIAM614_21522 [Stappia aggregata IAM 12614] [Roseibium aggregatum IAM 12614]
MGGLQVDIQAHRDGEKPSQNLEKLIGLAKKFSDSSNLVVYRGISVDEVPIKGSVLSLKGISGWSLYPNVALGLAKVQLGQHKLVMREKCQLSEQGLFIDEWEQEIIRLDLTKSVTRITKGTRSTPLGDESVYVLDLA